MSDMKSQLGDPTKLAAARTVAHAAVQPLTKAARANLAAAPDDSHSNLEWSTQSQMFLTHPLGDGAHRYQVGLTLAPLCLVFLRDGAQLHDLALSGQSLAQAEDWLDSHLQEVGLSAAGPYVLRYDLPAEVVATDHFTSDDSGLAALAAWFTLAASTLQTFANGVTGLTPGPSPVRCWPHHFDIATYIGLEQGDFETAAGIGAGLSPGDGSYDQPYFYVNPWPHLATDALPPAVSPGHWHTVGFVGSIATGTEILTLENTLAGTTAFLRDSFAAGRKGIKG